MSIFNKIFGKPRPETLKNEQAFEKTEQVQSPPLDNESKFKLLSQRSKEHFNNGDFGLYRNALYDMAEICYKEGNYRPSVNLFCEVAYWDMSHLSNNDAFWKHKTNYYLMITSLEYMYNDYKIENWVTFCAPGCRNRLITLQKKMELPEKDFFDLVKDDMAYFSAPFHPLTNEECAKLLISIIRDPENPYKTAFVNGRHRILEAIKQCKTQL